MHERVHVEVAVPANVEDRHLGQLTPVGHPAGAVHDLQGFAIRLRAFCGRPEVEIQPADLGVEVDELLRADQSPAEKIN